MHAALLTLYLLFPTAELNLPAGTFADTVSGAHDTVLLPRRNLLTNASFEWDFEAGNRGVQDGLAFGWSIWGQDQAYGMYSPTSIPSFDADALEGARSQKIAISAVGETACQISQDAWGLQPGQPYTFSLQTRLDDPAAADIQLAINFIDGETWVSEALSEPASPKVWQRLSVTGPAPDGGRKARCRIIVRPKRPEAKFTLWLESAQLEQSAAASAFTPQFAVADGDWVSQPLDLREGGGAGRLAWIASEPAGTHVRFQARSAPSREALEQAPWRGPAGGDWYGTAVPTGPDLVGPERRSIGYGENDREFTPANGVWRAAITKYEGGNGRWQAACDGSQFQPGQRVRFEVTHREDRETTPLSMSVAFQPAEGETLWGRFGRTVKASTDWKTDGLTFDVPHEVPQTIWIEIALQGVGWVETRDYHCRAVVGDEAWAVNPASAGQRFVQVRAQLHTDDLAESPILYQVRLDASPVPAEVRWFGLSGDDASRLRYRFEPGETVRCRPQVAIYPTCRGEVTAKLSLTDPAGRDWPLTVPLQVTPVTDQLADLDGRVKLPPDAPVGEWCATLQVSSPGVPETASRAIFKVSRPFTAPPPEMRLTAIVSDYGFARYKGQGLQDLIALYRSAKGLDGWLVSPSWSRLEPAPGQFDPEVVEGLRTIIAAAGESGLTARVAIQQQYFPAWVNNGAWDNERRYQRGPSQRLADTWGRLAAALKDVPGLDGYQLINEENAIRDADDYLRAMALTHAAIRAADPDLRHRVVIRPNTRDPYLRTRIAADGAFDYDYGSGGYPTHSSWYFKQYAHPISRSSFMRMIRFRLPPAVLGAAGGIGEIGFFNRKGVDDFGDEAKLAGFERAMRIAWQMGMDEFCLWSGDFSFADLPTYLPRLAAFRDELVKTPRPARFDVALVLDTNDPLYVESGRSGLDMAKQPFAAVASYLDGQGYVWYVTAPAAEAVQTVRPTVRVLASAVVGQPLAVLQRLLQGVRPSGEPLPWPQNDE